MQWLLKLFNTIHTPRETHSVLQMHFADAICANAICAIAKLKTIKNLFNNNLILLYIVIYNNINIIIYLNEYIFDFQIAQLHNCTIAQLLKHTGSGVLCVLFWLSICNLATCNFATCKKISLDDYGWIGMNWDELRWVGMKWVGGM